MTTTQERSLSAPAVAPVRAAGVELLGELAGSGYRKAPALVRRADGQVIQLTPLLYQLLRAIDGSRSYRDLAATVGTRVNLLLEDGDVRYLVEQKLRPLGLMQQADGSEPVTAKANPLLALKLKVSVTNAAVTRRLTSPFAWLFHGAVAVPAVAAFGLMVGWLLFEKGLGSAAHQALYEPIWLLAVFALTLVSAGFHELGHAAACRYGGATPGVMGFGLYLVWPAFYTDVSDSYRLGRAGRLRVDLGGLYFNALFAIAVFATWLVTHVDAILLLVLTQLLQMLRQLAPFIRADGYHVIADLTGVPDLFAHIGPTLRGLLPTRWRKRESQALKPWARLVVTAWVAIIVPVLLGCLVLAVVLLPRIAATAYDSIGLQSTVVRGDWSKGDVAGAAVGVLAILSLGVFVLSIGYLLLRVARRLVRRAWTSTRGRPAHRAAAVVALAGLGAAAAWAWWPDESYEPIDEHDRGTLQLSFTDWVAANPEPQATAPTAPTATTTISASVADVAPTGPMPAVVVVPRPLGDSAVVAQQPSPIVIPLDETAPVPDVAASDWPFPWLPPPMAEPGDNLAQAINTVDGSFVYDVALALVWPTEDPVLHRNEAHAYASCSNCQTTAIAFQVILVVGTIDEFAPVNGAVAANYECSSCSTLAVAVQLVATLTEMPSAEVQEQITAVWTQLEQRADELARMSPEQILAELNGVQAGILEILVAADSTADAEATPAPSPTATGSAALSGAEDAVLPSESGGETFGPSPTLSPTPAPDATEPPSAILGPLPATSEPPSSPSPSESAPAETPAPSPTPTPEPDPSEPIPTPGTG